MAPQTYRTNIGVIGPVSCDPETAAAARAVGQAIAQRGGVLVCGAGAGVIEEATAGARAAGGMTVAILPGANARVAPINPAAEVALFTGLGDAYASVAVSTCEAIIAIGGGFGTLAGIAQALKARKPVVLLGSWSFQIDDISPTVPRASDAAEAVELAFAALATPAPRPR